MLTNDLISSVYGSLSSFGPTRLIPRTTMLSYVNFALAEIWCYDGRTWAFTNVQELCEPQVSDGTNVSFSKTLANPIYKIKSSWDVRNQTDKNMRILSEIPPEIGPAVNFPATSLKNWAIGYVHYVPFTKVVTFYNNSLPDGGAIMTTGAGYKLNYHKWFVPLTGANDETVPLPDHFMGCLNILTLSYAMPQYLQLGDNKEVNFYQRAQAMLANLTKTDAIQTQQLTSNIH